VKLKIIFLLAVLICCNTARAQNYEGDWNTLYKKMEAGSQSLSEMESFASKYKSQLGKYADNSTQLFSSIASFYYEKKEFKKAEEHYLQSYAYAKSATDTSLKHIVEYYLAVFHHNQNNYLEAEKYYVACMAGMAAVYGQSSREYTEIFFNYTALLVNLEKYTQAQPYIDALLYYYKTLDGEKNFKYINLQNYQAIIYQNLGEYTKAIDILSRICEEKTLLSLGDTASFVITQSNLGDVYRESGNYEMAIMNLKRAKQMFFAYKVKDRGTLASIENNLALCYKAIGNVKEAEDAYNNTIAIYKDLGETNTEGYCSTLSNKADLYRELGRLGEASELLLTALEIRKQRFGTKTENYANALSNLANVYFDAGYYKEALEKNIEANAIYKETTGELHQGYANSLNNLSLCYIQFGEYKKAEECKTKALEIIEKTVGKNHYRYASYLISTCGLYRKTNQLQRAEVSLKEALNLVEKNFGKKHEMYARTELALAELYAMSSRFEEATPLYFHCLDYYLSQLNSFFDAMSETDQMSYYSFVDPVFESYNLFLLNYKLSKPGKDLSEHTRRSLRCQLVLKSLLTNKSAKVAREVFSSGNAELIKIYSDWMTVKNQLINNFKSAEPAYDNNELVKKAADLEVILKSKLKGFGKQPEVTFETLKGALGEKEAAIELFKANEWINDTTSKIKYGAFVIKKNSVQPELIIFKNGNELDGAAFQNYSERIDNQKHDTSSYRSYFKNFEPALKDVSRAYLSADGVFQKINLLGLYDPSSKKYVQENLEIFQTANIASIVHPKEQDKPGNQTAILFGYPDYDFDFKKKKATENKKANELVAKRFGLTNLSKLPGTKTEVEEINKALVAGKWNSTVYMDEFASEENLRKVNSPKVLHIATHGFYLKDIETEDKSFLGFESSTIKSHSMLRSGIILAGAGPSTSDSTNTSSENDGIVTAYEASLLNLSNTDLVVLSACQTGLGDEMGSQGVAGLQRSLTIAGAKNIIMSLWPVDDDATKTLMTEFYKNYATSHSVESSFKLAQEQVKKTYKHPFFWGAFVLLKTFN
jgi:CHAT domain-containing protein